MMKKYYLFFLIIVLFGMNCKEKFIPSVQSPATGYLVVEGFISSGGTPTNIHLSHTTKLYDSTDIIYEDNATVNIEGENNEVFPIYNNGNGTYVSSPLALNDNEKYRLHIITGEGKEYISDFTTVKHTPVIDSISFTSDARGATIFVNTHDASGNIKYFKWDYDETWEFHSPYISNLKYQVNPFTGQIELNYFNFRHEYDSSIYTCWHYDTSKIINIGSSEQLTEDVIYFPLLRISPGEQKLSVLYSINVKQYALSHEAYLFYEKIKKNTEEFGTVFDPQPSELQGNIHCLTNSAETVVGYVDISEEKDLRVFISNAQVLGWNYEPDCNKSIIKNDPDSILVAGGFSFAPTTPHKTGVGIIDFFASAATCVDCTLTGTNVKPSFWP